ncbi:MAG TPA: sigma-E factor negative regulatory protein [Burkholderiales bacterium]|nr:sigma-E factor negative regulatory protein [Burkholderiales bacterium]
MEKISAFMDGEVDGAEANGQIARLKEESRLRAGWETYHLIGDTLRGERIQMSGRFVETFSARLASEPTVLAPRPRNPLQTAARRVALPMAAAVGGMALVAWVALFNNPFAPPKENVAKAPAAAPAGTQVAGDQRVNDLLWAHRQVSSSTPVAGVPDYVQTVSEQEAKEKH